MAPLPSMTTSPNAYRGFRFPAEVIQHAVWLYHCFSLSLRDVELVLAARGVVVSYEIIREWGLRCGRLFASTQKRHRPKPGDKWHLAKCSSASAARCATFGAQWTSMETCSTSWSRAGAARRRPSGSSASW